MEEAEPAVSMVGSGEPLPGQEEEGEPQSSGQQEGSNDIYLEMEPAAPPARSSRLPERGGRGEPGQRRRRRWRKGREVLAREEHQEIGEQPAGVDLGEPPQDSPGPDPPGPEQQQEEPQAPPPLKRHVYCTVYCVENDSPGEQPPGEPQDEPPPFFPSLSGTNPHYSPGLEPGGGWLVLACCRVCLEDKQLKPLACCRKPVCEECLKRYLGSQVQLGQAEIKCPITECTELLEETTILYNLPHDDIIKYKYFLELSRMDSTTKPCPQCKHFTTLKRKGHIPTPSKVENKFKVSMFHQAKD